MIQSILKYKNKFWLLVSIAVAFGLRVYMLGAQSLWNDEGASVALAALNAEAIINGAAKDIHPPLYYFLLHFWMPLVGNTEYAIRFLSVIAGVLVVAVTFRLARLFFDEEVAIIAAFFAAFSPFQVYYSQETRMYIWVTLWSAVSVLAMAVVLGKAKACPERSRRSKSEKAKVGTVVVWLTYVAATIAALYTHYFAITLVLFENLTFILWWLISIRSIQLPTSNFQSPISNLQSPISDLTHWLIGQLVVGLAFLPWYLFAGNQLFSWPSISEPFDLLTLLWRVLNVFSVGLSLDAGSALPIALAFGILFLFGLRWTREPHENRGTVLLVSWALIPVLFMYVVSLARPAYNPKFLLLVTPAFLILVARGLSRIHPGIFLHQRHPAVAFSSLRYFFLAVAALAAIGFIPSLRNYYGDPRYARDDYRAILKRIDSATRPGDGILVNAPGQIEVVRYYHRGAQPLFLLPRMRPPETAATRADVDDMLAKTPRLFAIYYATEQSDPQRIIETRLAEKAFKARDEWHGNVRLAVYGVTPARRGEGVMLDAQLGDGIILAGFQLDQREIYVGDVLTLTLYWRLVQTPEERYKVFVHLLDANDIVVAQRDGEPVGDTRITTTWRAGERIADNYGILVEAGVLPGFYRVEIGMYRADNGARLPMVAPDGQSVGDHLVIGTVQVLK
ncbi:MAG: glycosyltransferase family 39 protein [Chloroflexi bacterium]|nr:glycosyltransferase family 39 protein [Chloroflexota bacterium]